MCVHKFIHDFISLSLLILAGILALITTLTIQTFLGFSSVQRAVCTHRLILPLFTSISFASFPNLFPRTPCWSLAGSPCLRSSSLFAFPSTDHFLSSPHNPLYQNFFYCPPLLPLFTVDFFVTGTETVSVTDFIKIVLPEDYIVIWRDGTDGTKANY